MLPAQQLKPLLESEPIFLREEVDRMVQHTEERIAEQRKRAMEDTDFNTRMQAA